MAVTRLRYCANNEWKESSSGKNTPAMNPSTGEQFAETPVCIRVEINSDAVKAAFPVWPATPVVARTKAIFRFRELVNKFYDINLYHESEWIVKRIINYAYRCAGQCCDAFLEQRKAYFTVCVRCECYEGVAIKVAVFTCVITF